jgi:hypothetical protein
MARENSTMTADVCLAKPRKSLLRKFFGFGIRDEFEQELSKLESFRLATRKKLTLRKKTITRTDASITVENVNTRRSRVTVRASIYQTEIYSSHAVYEPDVVSKTLRKRLPTVLDSAELDKPIGHLADDMSSSEIRLIMERATAREEAKRRSQAQHMLKQPEQSVADQETKVRQKGRLSASEERSLVPKSRSTAVSINPTASKTPVQSHDEDDPSQLKYYQRLGVISQEQSRMVLKQQREKLQKVREQERLNTQNFARGVASSIQRRTNQATQSYYERRLSIGSEGEDIGLVPREAIRDMRIKSASNAQSVSRIAKRPTISSARTNPFFRNRDKSLLVAKLSSVSLELGLSGEAASVVPDTDVIGAIAPSPQSKTVSASLITVSEETISIDPDNPIPKRSEQPTYRYRPLESDQHFRLLAVEPFIESGRFLYEIRTFGMNDAPPFESVSYVWGQDKRNFKLSFSDSSVLKITRSLFAALPIFSEHCRTGYLWIDQLCIDQSNVDERNHQVKSMGTIYRQAAKVLVFLDPVPRVTYPEGLFTLLSFVERSLSVTSTPRADALLQEGLAQVIKPHYSELSNHAICWRDLVRLFEHPWFTRAWIFQELVLSDIVLFAMGRRLVPLDAILHLALPAASLEGRSLSDFKPNECLTRSPGLRQLQLMAKARNERMTRGNIDPKSFWDILSQVAPNCRSSDERDKLYAFLGLLEDPHIDIQPDYRSSVTEVFVHAASAVIAGQESLDLLAFVDRATGSRNSRAGFPSWVPDWRQSQTVKLFNQRVFSAAIRRKHVAATLIDSSQSMNHGLLVRGRIIDQITYVAVSSFYGAKPLESRDVCSFLNLEERVDRLIRNFGKSLGKPTEVLERLLRTILADGAEASMLLNGIGYTPLHPAKVKELLQIYHWYGRFVALHRNSIQPIQAKSTAPAPIPVLLQQLRQLSDIAFGRRIFATKNSRLGLGPERVAIGDYICILHGSSLPVVLRNQTHVMGQCFLEGVMQGEAVKWTVDEADEFWIV